MSIIFFSFYWGVGDKKQDYSFFVIFIQTNKLENDEIKPCMADNRMRPALIPVSGNIAEELVRYKPHPRHPADSRSLMEVPCFPIPQSSPILLVYCYTDRADFSSALIECFQWYMYHHREQHITKSLYQVTYF